MSEEVEVLQVVPTLAECERVIERGQRTFIEVGMALAAIRDNRLYRDTHRTFEAYCRDRWGMSSTHAYRQIAAARRAEMSPVGDKPENERQARRLAALPDNADNDSQTRADPGERELWDRLVAVMDDIEALTASDAESIAATVPDRRRAATARRLRRLGTVLGRVAWLLEAGGE